MCSPVVYCKIPSMKLIIGLGNPGKEYAGTRHNVGFDLVDELAKKYEADWKSVKSRSADCAKIMVDDQAVILAKPQTFMNLSGRAGAALTNFYKIQPSDILVVQDELDLEPGTFTFSHGGRSGGHHGIDSIQQSMPGMVFTRLRLGIGKPKLKSADHTWVLGKPDKTDASLIKKTLQDACPAVVDWVNHGLDYTRNHWNSKKKIKP